jgi:hypothetical protein
MSIVFEIKLDGEHRQGEVTRDGELFFLDYDINFDIAAQEFGYKMTEAAWLYQRWQADLLNALLHKIPDGVIDNKAVALMSVEYAERVLPIFEPHLPKDKRARALLVASRGLIEGAVDEEHVKSLRRRFRSLGEFAEKRVIREDEGGVEAGLAAYHVAEIARSAIRELPVPNWFNTMQQKLLGIINSSQRAVAYEFCNAHGFETHSGIINQRTGMPRFPTSDEFQAAERSEAMWQVRRFVDVLEAIGQGRDWPDLKVTT